MCYLLHAVLSYVPLQPHLGHIQSWCSVPTDLAVDLQDCTVLHKNSRPGLGVFLYGWELRRLQHPAARVGFVFDWRSATKKGVVLELLGAFTRMQSQLDLLGPSKMTSNCFKFFQQLGTSQLLKLHSRLGGRSEGGDTLDRYELLIAVLQHLAEVGYRKHG